MTGKRILITGVNGYLGSCLRDFLAENCPGNELSGLDIRVPARTAGKEKIFVADLADERKIMKLLIPADPDYIFHLAGVIWADDWKEYYLHNVNNTKVLMDIVRKERLKAKVIIPGSAAEYGYVPARELPVTEKYLTSPLSLYGLSKCFQTAVSRYYSGLGVNVVVGRIFNFIGSNVSTRLAVGAFIHQLKMIRSGKIRKEMEVGNLGAKRDYLDVRDVCRGLVAIADKGKKGEVYNICSGNSLSMKSLLRMMIDQTGLKIAVQLNEKRLKEKDIPDIYGSNRKIYDQTGWKPEIDIKNSIRKALELD